MKSRFRSINRSEHPVPIKKAFGVKIAFFYEMTDVRCEEAEMRGSFGSGVKLTI